MRSSIKPEIRELWAAALESGVYIQGKGSLHVKSVNRHYWCCLGVLCDLAVKAGVVTAQRNADNFYTYDGDGSILPVAVFQWAGLDGCNPVLREAAYFNDAASLNDHINITFPEIAQLVRALPDAQEEEESGTINDQA